MSNEAINAGNLLNEILTDLQNSRLPLFSHRELVIYGALCKGIARLCREAEDNTDRKIDLLETEIKSGASRLKPDTIDAPCEDE